MTIQQLLVSPAPSIDPLERTISRRSYAPRGVPRARPPSSLPSPRTRCASAVIRICSPPASTLTPSGRDCVSAARSNRSLTLDTLRLVRPSSPQRCGKCDRRNPAADGRLRSGGFQASERGLRTYVQVITGLAKTQSRMLTPKSVFLENCRSFTSFARAARGIGCEASCRPAPPATRSSRGALAKCRDLSILLRSPICGSFASGEAVQITSRETAPRRTYRCDP